VIIAFWRGLLAVVLGLATFFVVVLGGEFANYTIHGLHIENPNDPAAFNEFIKSIPLSALIVVVVVWGVAAFAGSWVATSLAPSRKIAFGLLIGVMVLVGTIGNLLSIPHPVWMWVVGIAEALPAAYLGARLARGRRAGPAVV
jgi:uncharacterized membrane-anchored protein